MTMTRCRTCLCMTSAPHSIPLFQPEPQLAALLAELTQLQVLRGDSLPEMICKTCHSQLCTSQIFINKARESYHILQNDLKKMTMNGDKSPTIHKSSVADNPEINFKDIKIDNDKDVQVDFRNGMLDGDKNVNETTVFCENNKINKCKIKQEPNDLPMEYDQMEPYSNGMHEDNLLIINQIKIEPLSECDALKFHEKVGRQSPPMYDKLKQSNEDIKCANPKCEFMNEDVKPTKKELFAYTAKINHLENFHCKKENTSNNCLNEYAETPDNSLLSEYEGLSTKNCILCNKCFKTKQNMKEMNLNSETSLERKRRLTRERQRKFIERNRERILQNRKLARLNETEEAKNRRRELNAANMSRAREAESVEARNRRRELNAASMSRAREAESEVATNKRRKLNAASMSRSREAESLEVKNQRELNTVRKSYTRETKSESRRED